MSQASPEHMRDFTAHDRTHDLGKDDVILVTGGTGLVGSAVAAHLRSRGHRRVVAVGSRECNLADRASAEALFAALKPAFVFHCAGQVYGIGGNLRNKGRSFLRNVLINTHVIEASRAVGVKKVIAMGSGAVYPYPAPGSPLRESMIWAGLPHPSEDSYAQAKRAMLAQLLAYRESDGLDFAFVVSANLYGPGDRFDVENGHVVPALVRKFFEAREAGSEVVVWGDGSARRDFLYVEDAARALVAIAMHAAGPVNLGSGVVSRIRDIVETLARLAGLADRVVWDSARPNGQDHRAYDLTRLAEIGFRNSVSLEEGLRRTYGWYAENANRARKDAG